MDTGKLTDEEILDTYQLILSRLDLTHVIASWYYSKGGKEDCWDHVSITYKHNVVDLQHYFNTILGEQMIEKTLGKGDAEPDKTTEAMKTKTMSSWLTKIEDSDLINEAFKAYFKKYGKDAMRPSTISSTVGRKYVEIRNGTDLLSKYDIKKKKII